MNNLTHLMRGQSVMGVRPSRAALLACLTLFVFFSFVSVPVNATSLGINMPWLDGAYDHDLGYNAFHPSWGVSYNADEVERYMTDIRAHNLNVVRMFICEGFQGFTFNSAGRVSGLQPIFVKNLKDFVGRANSHGISVYVVLLDAYSFKTCFGTPLAKGDKMADILEDPLATTDLIENGIVPIVRILKYYNIYGYDLINDANIARNWPQVRIMAKQAVKAMHEESSSAHVTISDGNSKELIDGFSTTVGGLGLDFYDVHDYFDMTKFNNNNSGANAPLLPNPSIATDGKPFILGEFAASDPKTGDDQWKSLIDQYVSQISQQGYAGAFLWCYLPDGANYEVVDQKLTWNAHGWNWQWYGKNKYGQ